MYIYYSLIYIIVNMLLQQNLNMKQLSSNNNMIPTHVRRQFLVRKKMIDRHVPTLGIPGYPNQHLKITG